MKLSGKTAEVPRVVPLRTRLLALLIATAVRAVCATVRLRVENDAVVRDLAEQGKGLIMVTWHGRTLLPIHHLRGRGYWALISLSKDGDLQAVNFRLFGFRVIRGSTGRRGVAATREVLAALNDGGVLAFTPDGPRGPSQKVQPGVVYFAQRAGCAIVPAGISAWPRWQMRSWDKFLVPKPFSRAWWIWGEPIFVAPDETLESASARVEAALCAVEAEAERRVCPKGGEDA